MASAGDEKEYLVRGAMLECKMGSMPKRMNLPVGHGVYLLDNPMINKMDSKPMVNIMPFGTCSCTGNPTPCIPATVGPWMKTHGMAVTMDSFLVCAKGGLIEPKTSGQEYKD